MMSARGRSVAGIPAGASGSAPFADASRPELPGQLPDSDILEFGSFGISIEQNLAYGNDVAAWYGLQQFKVGTDCPDDLIWTSWMLDMQQADTAGTGSTDLAALGTAVGFGNNIGWQAYIVLGVNLGISYGRWSPGPLLPTVGGTGDAVQISRAKVTQRIILPWCNGQTASPNFLSRSENRAPLPLRVPKGASLDVAFVCKSTVVNGKAAPSYLRVTCCGHLIVSRLTSMVSLGR